MDKVLKKAIAMQKAERLNAWKEGFAKGFAQGFVEGFAEGRAEGARENQLATAKTALLMGITHADVAQLTGLDAATVDELARQL